MDEDQEGNDILGALFGEAESSVPTSELPSTIPTDSTEESDAIAYGERRVMPARLPFDTNATRNLRPGWSGTTRPTSTIIFYLCYGKGHMANRCTCALKDMRVIKHNFESLTEEERKGVPDESYKRVCAFLAAGNAETQQPAEGNAAQTNPKN